MNICCERGKVQNKTNNKKIHRKSWKTNTKHEQKDTLRLHLENLCEQ